MCIPILKKAEGTITKETLQNCWTNNSDGGGILYIKDRALHRLVELKEFDKFYEHYETALNEGGDSPMLIHFRIATSGSVIDQNAHPFIVNKNIGFIHNGVISETSYPKDANGQFLDVSDTWVFNENLKTLKGNWWDNSFILSLLNKRIGTTGNKICFLTNLGKWTILNENLGHWRDNNNVWYSNLSCEMRNYSSGYDYFHGYSGSKSGKKHQNNKWFGHSSNPPTLYNSQTVADKDKTTYDNCEICAKFIYTQKEILNNICESCFEQEYPELALATMTY